MADETAIDVTDAGSKVPPVVPVLPPSDPTPPAPVEAAPEPVPATKTRKGYVCGICGGPVVPYAGENPHKVGTGWCDTDGRQPLKG